MKALFPTRHRMSILVLLLSLASVPLSESCMGMAIDTVPYMMRREIVPAPARVEEKCDPVCSAIEARLTATGGPLIIQGQRILTDPDRLRRFYVLRHFRPVWTEADRPSSAVQILFDTIRLAGAEGLATEDYLRVSKDFRYRLFSLIGGGGEWTPEHLADLDFILTDAFVMLSHDLSYGRVNTDRACSTECFGRRHEELLVKLGKAMEGGLFSQMMREIIPQNPAYAKLREIRTRYRQIAAQGGWPPVPPGERLKRGDRNSRVSALRARLRCSGDLADDTAAMSEEYYDAAIERGVRRFQERNGLTVNGAVDGMTLRAMNRPVEDDIHQIELNLERLRWLPTELGEAHIIVNIPDFRLTVVEAARNVMSMRTIIGRHLWHTPSFSDEITYLEVNPKWKIPVSILREEILPTITRDPDYIKRKDIRFYGQKGKVFREVLPDEIDWAKVQPRRFPYQVVQESGPANPLGRLKFVFPNENDVYLHDTPSKSLFRRERRMFSHGCIRIEKPFELATFLLKRDQGWSAQRLRKAVNSARTQQILLRQPVPIHIVYFTAWVDETGTLQLRHDVYNSDAVLDMALRKRAELLAETSVD